MNDQQKQHDHYYCLAKSFASRYKVATDQREDLVQEGYLAYLESLDKGCSHPSIIETNMRKAMYNMVNFKQRPIPVPASGQSYSFLKRILEDVPVDELSTTEKALYYALTGESVSVATLDREMQMASHEGSLALGMAVTKALDEEEASVFRKIAIHGYTNKEVADATGVSKQRVNQVYQSALNKLREILE